MQAGSASSEGFSPSRANQRCGFKTTNIPKEVEHRIPDRGSSRCRTKMKENMTFFCVAFEEGGQSEEGKAKEVAGNHYL